MMNNKKHNSLRATATNLLTAALLLCIAGGCGVQRTMTINSEPAGAIVYLNDREVGRTPVRFDFTWYGKYDVELRKEGFETLKTKQWVVAPAWQWFPLDLVAELMPFRPTDDRKYAFTLAPAETGPTDAKAILDRAVELKAAMP